MDESELRPVFVAKLKKIDIERGGKKEYANNVERISSSRPSNVIHPLYHVIHQRKGIM